MTQVRVRVWNEFVHEQRDPAVQEVYPEGIHGAVASGIREHLGDAVTVSTATLESPDLGLSPAELESTDVLLWWGHLAHGKVPSETAAAVQQRVLDGMGLIVLHSGHLSKPFVRLMGTRCTLRWREADDREIVWTTDPSHPIAEGVPHPFVIDRQEMYGEFFDVPPPDALVFVSSFTGGEVFRSGCCWTRGKGRVFYFSPGHETYPVYHHPVVRRVLANAVRWAHQPQPSPIDTTVAANSPSGWFERR